MQFFLLLLLLLLRIFFWFASHDLVNFQNCNPSTLNNCAQMEQLKARAELKISELMANAALEKQRLREEISAVASASATTGRATGV